MGDNTLRKIFVGRLSRLTSEGCLKSYFQQYGPVTLAEIIKDEYGITRCLGFVTFEDATTVDTVIGRIHVIDRRQLDVQRAKAPVDYGLAENVEHRARASVLRVYLSGLPKDASDADIKGALTHFGVVVDLTVFRKGKGTALAGLSSVERPDQLFLESIFIMGKRIEVKPSAPNRAKRRK